MTDDDSLIQGYETAEMHERAIQVDEAARAEWRFEEEETPRVGKDVHFVGTEPKSSCTAAKITRVSSSPIFCALSVFHVTELTFEIHVPLDVEMGPRSWHWAHNCPIRS